MVFAIKIDYLRIRDSKIEGVPIIILGRATLTEADVELFMKF